MRSGNSIAAEDEKAAVPAEFVSRLVFRAQRALSFASLTIPTKLSQQAARRRRGGCDGGEVTGFKVISSVHARRQRLAGSSHFVLQPAEVHARARAMGHNSAGDANACTNKAPQGAANLWVLFRVFYECFSLP